MIILGINDGCHHNSAASILIDGKLVASVELERISRIKNDGAFPHAAIDEVLVIAGLNAADVDIVAKANLTRWQQIPFLNRYYDHMAKLGKTDSAISKIFWKKQFERHRRVPCSC